MKLWKIEWRLFNWFRSRVTLRSFRPWFASGEILSCLGWVSICYFAKFLHLTRVNCTTHFLTLSVTAFILLPWIFIGKPSNYILKILCINKFGHLSWITLLISFRWVWSRLVLRMGLFFICVQNKTVIIYVYILGSWDIEHGLSLGSLVQIVQRILFIFHIIGGPSHESLH
jgi:hypothetical protein